jgi:hypothetical protein
MLPDHTELDRFPRIDANDGDVGSDDGTTDRNAVTEPFHSIGRRTKVLGSRNYRRTESVADDKLGDKADDNNVDDNDDDDEDS